MSIAKVIQERIRKHAGGIRVDGDVNAGIAANMGESGQVTSVSVTQEAASEPRSEPDAKPASKPA